MIASVHLADVGLRSAFSITRKDPPPGSIPGLRNANLFIAAPLSGSVIASPQFGRAGLVAFWDGDDALDRFLAGDARAAKFSSGWHIRLAPLRAHGTWPGLPREEIPTERHVEHEGPVAAITLGRLRASQAIRFLRASAKAEASALSTYTYGTKDLGHPDAIARGDAKPFHHQQTFIRFRPYAAQGRLDGRNPLKVSLPA